MAEPPEPAPLSKREWLWQKVHEFGWQRKRQLKWAIMLDLTLMFYEEFGICPERHDIYGGETVGIWFYRQKKFGVRTEDAPERETLLILCFGENWNDRTTAFLHIHSVIWDNNFEKLQRFFNRNGRLPRVKDKMDFEDDPSIFGIGEWLNNQVSTSATPDRVKKLKDYLSQCFFLR